MRKYFRIGKIISLHGIKGEVKIFPTTDDIKRFDKLIKFYIVNSENASDDDFKDLSFYEKESVKYLKNTVVLRIKGIDSIESATKYIGKNLYVDRDAAVDLSLNEYYVMDLIGMKAYYKDKEVGKVVDIIKTKANDIVVITFNDKEVLVPMVSDYIEKVDLENALIIFKGLEGLIWRLISWRFFQICLMTF